MYSTSPGLARVLFLLCMVLPLCVTTAVAQPCPNDGDVNQDTNITPADALLAFQHFLEIANPPLDACQQDHANVDDPTSSGITPADALCIFQSFLELPSCLDVAPLASSGPITGFGSVIVNGVEIETESANIRLDEVEGTETELGLGMVVTVQGTIDGTGRTRATTVTFDDDLEGPIASIETANSTLVVLGQTVVVDDLTVIEDSGQAGSLLLTDLAVGDVVQVSGRFDANGALRATRIERKPGGFTPDVTEVERKGIISNFDGTTSIFTLTGLQVNFGAAMVQGTLGDGVFVEAKGTQAADGVVNATRVEVEDRGLAGAEGTEVAIEGFVTSVTPGTPPTTFSVDGQPVQVTDQTVFENGVREDVALNVKLEAEGQLDASGTLVARKISFRRQGGGTIEIEAMVEAVDTDNNTVTLLGLVVQIEASTLLQDDTNGTRDFNLSHIAVDDWLEVRGFADGEGIDVVAGRLERDDPKDEVVLQGPVGSVARPTLTILGATVQTDGTTEFKDANDTPLTADAFFAQVQAGTLVQAKGTLQDGVILAQEVDIEND